MNIKELRKIIKEEILKLNEDRPKFMWSYITHNKMWRVTARRIQPSLTSEIQLSVSRLSDNLRHEIRSVIVVPSEKDAKVFWLELKKHNMKGEVEPLSFTKSFTKKYGIGFNG